MKKLCSDEEIVKLIEESPMSVIYFTGIKCGACEIIKFKVNSILNKFPNVKSGEINGEENLDIAAKYGVFSLPILLLFIDGKESIRVGKNIDLRELERNIKRYYEMIF